METAKNLKVLIVEDDPTSELFLRLALESISREFVLARTGSEGVELCHKHPDTDLVLMDIRMPDLNGYEATKQIRKFNQNVVIIAQTAFALSGDREKALSAGCNDHIPKPVNAKLLIEKINKHCKLKQL